MNDWEILVNHGNADDSKCINDAIELLSDRIGGGTVYLEPAVYKLTTPIERRSNVTIKGAFCGAHIFDNTVSTGTVLKRQGGSAGAVLYDAPHDTPQDERIDNGGVSDLTIDGSGTAGIGLMCMNAYCARYARLHCVGVTRIAYYFGTIKVPSMVPNYHSRLDDLNCVVTGMAHGIVLDGVVGSGLNTCFVSARNCHVTFIDGVAYALCNCDDNGFLDCAASMVVGSKGTAIYFGGGAEKSSYGNHFIGFNSNAPIVAGGGLYPSRGNLVLTNAVDGVPLIYRADNATLTVEVYDGESGLNGFVRNPLRGG